MIFNVGFLIGVIPIATIGIFVGVGVKLLSQAKKNYDSPVLSVPAVAVAKRVHYSQNSMSRYYVTFQFESGDRTEFSMTGREYGMIADEDFGTLTFQGNKYLSFERM